MSAGEDLPGLGDGFVAPEAPAAPASPYVDAPGTVSDTPGPAAEASTDAGDAAQAEPPRERDSMARPPTERYPGGRTSPPEPVAAERWAFHPDAPPPKPRLRRRLWWVLPFGVSVLVGMLFVAACLAYQATGHPDFAGKACSIVTILAVIVASLIATDLGFSALPTYPVAAACVGFFAAAPAVAWVLLALG